MEKDRLEALERSQRKLQRLVIMLGVGFAVLLAWQFAPGPDTVLAKRFLLKDDRGSIRAALEMWEGTKPTLRLNDTAGKARAMLFLNPDRGGRFRLTDNDGHHRVHMMLTPEGRPEIWLGNEEGRTQTQITLASDEGPGIALYDENLKWIWVAPPR